MIVLRLMDHYLAHARERLHEHNETFTARVDHRSRPYVEEVLGDLAASLDVLEVLRESIDEPAEPGGDAERPRTEIITILDAESIIHFQSWSITQELGYHQYELLGTCALELVHPSSRDAIQGFLAEARVRPRQESPPITFLFRHRQGGFVALETRVRPIVEEGAAVGFVARSRRLDGVPAEPGTASLSGAP